MVMAVDPGVAILASGVIVAIAILLGAAWLTSEMKDHHKNNITHRQFIIAWALNLRGLLVAGARRNLEQINEYGRALNRMDPVNGGLTKITYVTPRRPA